MSTAREDVAAYVSAETGLRVAEAVKGIENARKPLVLVARANVEVSPLPNTRDDHLTVWILAPEIDPVRAEGSLDKVVDQVLDAFDRHEFLHWDTASRDTYADAFHAFRVNVVHRTVITREDTNNG